MYDNFSFLIYIGVAFILFLTYMVLTTIWPKIKGLWYVRQVKKGKYKMFLTNARGKKIYHSCGDIRISSYADTGVYIWVEVHPIDNNDRLIYNAHEKLVQYITESFDFEKIKIR